jgi:uncharacterized Fe-S cluster-containing radical SAM superfamily protein
MPGLNTVVTKKKEPYSIFLSEWLAIDRSSHQLPISAVCNSRCIFCSNHLNPFPIKKGVFRDLDDIKTQLSVMMRHNEVIRMSDSLPGRISEGEAFLHPKLFEILELVRRKYPANLLNFTSNGSMLTESFVQALEQYQPIEITISMHSTQPDLWAKIYGKSQRMAQTAINSLALLKKHDITILGAIVPLPRLCGWDDIEHTVKTFVDHGAASVILWWPGYTLETPPEVVKEIECSIEEFIDFGTRMQSKYNIPVLHHPDMKQSLKVDVRRILMRTMRGNLNNKYGPFRHVLWLCSEAARERLETAVKKHSTLLSNIQTIYPVKNMTYQGNICTAGLLTVEDFIGAGLEALGKWPDIDLILVPRIPFDSLYLDLRRTPAFNIPEKLKRQVWLVDDLGRHDPVLMRSFIPKYDVLTNTIIKLMNEFNKTFVQDDTIGTSLDMVDAFPVQTTFGAFDRIQLAEFLSNVKKRLYGETQPANQLVEVLDDNHVVCIEKWIMLKESTRFNRWTFWIRHEESWKINSIQIGEDLDEI